MMCAALIQNEEGFRQRLGTLISMLYALCSMPNAQCSMPNAQCSNGYKCENGSHHTLA